MPPHLVRPESHIAAPSWDDGWQPSASAEIVRGALWCRRGMRAAHARCLQAGSNAFDEWTAAVEGVWWAVALDDVLYKLHDQRYVTERALHRDGETVVGLRWLRHHHAHQIVVTGQGGPKRDFIPTNGGPPFYISPSNRWLKRSAMSTEWRKTDATTEAAYDARVASHPLADPLGESAKWFDDVFSAAGIDPHQDIAGDDPTVL